MLKGLIVRINPKMFGFVKNSSDGNEYCFSKNDVRGVDFDDLRSGQKVQFELEGTKAVNVSTVAS